MVVKQRAKERRSTFQSLNNPPYGITPVRRVFCCPLRHGADAPRHLPRTRGRQPSPSQSAGASCATSPARVGGSPLRHSPLARPVPPPPHAWEVNVTYRSGLPRLRGRWPAGPERATFTGLRSKNRAPQPWPAGPERAKAEQGNMTERAAFSQNLHKRPKFRNAASFYFGKISLFFHLLPLLA